MEKLKKNIIECIKNHSELIILCIITIISFVIRIIFIKNASDDFRAFAYNWYNMLKENGGIKGLGISMGDYNVPYLFFLALLTYIPIHPIFSIKLLSILFDYICAFAVMKIIFVMFERKKRC